MVTAIKYKSMIRTQDDGASLDDDLDSLMDKYEKQEKKPQTVAKKETKSVS